MTNQNRPCEFLFFFIKFKLFLKHVINPIEQKIGYFLTIIDTIGIFILCYIFQRIYTFVTQSIFLSLHSGIIPEGIRGPYMLQWLEPGKALYKFLHAVLFFCLLVLLLLSFVCFQFNHLPYISHKHRLCMSRYRIGTLNIYCVHKYTYDFHMQIKKKAHMIDLCMRSGSFY